MREERGARKSRWQMFPGSMEFWSSACPGTLGDALLEGYLQGSLTLPGLLLRLTSAPATRSGPGVGTKLSRCLTSPPPAPTWALLSRALGPCSASRPPSSGPVLSFHYSSSSPGGPGDPLGPQWRSPRSTEAHPAPTAGPCPLVVGWRSRPGPYLLSLPICPVGLSLLPGSSEGARPARARWCWRPGLGAFSPALLGPWASVRQGEL